MTLTIGWKIDRTLSLPDRCPSVSRSLFSPARVGDQQLRVPPGTARTVEARHLKQQPLIGGKKSSLFLRRLLYPVATSRGLPSTLDILGSLVDCSRTRNSPYASRACGFKRAVSTDGVFSCGLRRFVDAGETILLQANVPRCTRPMEGDDAKKRILP